MSPTFIYIVGLMTIWTHTGHSFPSLEYLRRNIWENYPDFFEYPEVIERQVKVAAPVHDPSFPAADVKVGQVGGLAVDQNQEVLVFHRADRVWDGSTFDGDTFRDAAQRGPIQNDTIFRLDPVTGNILKKFGAGKFYLPHGLTVDGKGNLWLTDVAMHQVMRIPKDKHDPDLTLGEFLVPGSDDKHFCKPTDVAVTSTGEFFVADGYCNGRILKYDKDGNLLTKWGYKYEGPVRDAGDYGFYIPHSLTLLEEQDIICVADREHGRILCYRAGLKNSNETGRFVGSIDKFGRVFAIEYDPNANFIYAVDGPSFRGSRTSGFTVAMDGTILAKWAPMGQGFGQPHDITVSPDGKNIYVGEIRPDRVTKFSRRI